MKILRITSSPRKEYSKSIKLGAAIIEKLLAAHPGASVKHKDLTASPFPHLEEVHLKGFYTPVEYRLPGYDEAVRHSDEAIAEIKEADVLVIEAPLYNLTISSTLKAWIDHIVRNDITFRHTPDGDVGLLTGKKVYVAVTAGYIYSEGPGKAKDFVRPLLQAILGMLGITDVTFIMAEGLSVPGVKETAFQKALDSIKI
ncbi:FMN-dependent NADH-azoreductase [Chitinophaga sp. 30R24]|uniref:FMN-dependent NADH-azoreductase n=1 Tax=Chitinophaga sp. 30R24 TaxID=3248838 RepID=UPI003B8F2178